MQQQSLQQQSLQQQSLQQQVGRPGSNAVLWFWHVLIRACVHCMHGAVACSECAALAKAICPMHDNASAITRYSKACEGLGGKKGQEDLHRCLLSNRPAAVDGVHSPETTRQSISGQIPDTESSSAPACDTETPSEQGLQAVTAHADF